MLSTGAGSVQRDGDGRCVSFRLLSHSNARGRGRRRLRHRARDTRHAASPGLGTREAVAAGCQSDTSK